MLCDAVQGSGEGEEGRKTITSIWIQAINESTFKLS